MLLYKKFSVKRQFVDNAGASVKVLSDTAHAEMLNNNTDKLVKSVSEHIKILTTRIII